MNMNTSSDNQTDTGNNTLPYVGCKLCNGGFYVNQSSIDSENQCIVAPDCDEGSYYDQMHSKCMKCPGECETCRSPSNCQSCSEGFSINQLTSKCNSICSHAQFFSNQSCHNCSDSNCLNCTSHG
jgi:hypothetical protein